MESVRGGRKREGVEIEGSQTSGWKTQEMLKQKKKKRVKNTLVHS